MGQYRIKSYNLLIVIHLNLHLNCSFYTVVLPIVSLLKNCNRNATTIFLCLIFAIYHLMINLLLPG
jgi:hypothetical protein